VIFIGGVAVGGTQFAVWLLVLATNRCKLQTGHCKLIKGAMFLWDDKIGFWNDYSNCNDMGTLSVMI
jgi:hypothetical protein